MDGCFLDKFDRFQLLHRQFRQHRKPIPIARLAALLECSEKTVKRAIENMRDYLDAPIEYVSEAKGWAYVAGEQNHYELPGLWLTSAELQSLALLLQLLESFGNGLLNQELLVVEQSITKLLTARGIERSAFDQHIKVLPLSNRYVASHMFAQVCEAVLKKRRLSIGYRNYQQQVSQREISPQTLVYYRENWYLDAWCHLRNDLRTFSLARIAKLDTLKTKTLPIADEQLAAHFTAGYGIFSGAAKYTARLRFGPELAHEIAMQQWHPEQAGLWQGRDYVLSLPYSDERELIQDILRYCPHVTVEQPPELKRSVLARLQQAIQQFE
ncbi:WYL domain-containing transcriptional regulator [Zhongshania sp.]|jgi:predicted DNA-binding transcriptional regulator YafY|uniref:helix-turn-helix transcriptional regulator n=1 Tax=Zhongshania sp. TaxID=1971902 RepID=UPI002A808D35|nr:WYL domain-containing transcriptional regulator [Zhongshania sp.]